MAASVSAFGYSVPLTVVLVVLALVIGLALAVMFWLTVGLSVYRSVGATRRERVHEELQAGLLDGLFDPEADWGPWVEDLSTVERDVVEDLLDEYLRELDGGTVERLRELGDELGVPERSERQLRRGGGYTRLYALTWLTLLSRPDRVRAAEFTPRTPRERALVARLRHESGDFDEPGEGISLLLEDATRQFAVFGQDTLYRLATEDPSALFEIAAGNYRAWSETLLVQVLSVCQHLDASVTTGDLSWLTRAVDDENEAVQAAAVRALGNAGWRDDVRRSLPLNRLAYDPSPQIRGAVYEMLARWGDDRALEALSKVLRTEADARTRLAGTNALVRERDRLQGDVPEGLANSWAWSKEHAEYDRIARQRSTPVGG